MGEGINEAMALLAFMACELTQGEHAHLLDNLHIKHGPHDIGQLV